MPEAVATTPASSASSTPGASPAAAAAAATPAASSSGAAGAPKTNAADPKATGDLKALAEESKTVRELRGRIKELEAKAKEAPGSDPTVATRAEKMAAIETAVKTGDLGPMMEAFGVSEDQATEWILARQAKNDDPINEHINPLRKEIGDLKSKLTEKEQAEKDAAERAKQAETSAKHTKAISIVTEKIAATETESGDQRWFRCSQHPDAADRAIKMAIAADRKLAEQGLESTPEQTQELLTEALDALEAEYDADLKKRAELYSARRPNKRKQAATPGTRRVSFDGNRGAAAAPAPERKQPMTASDARRASKALYEQRRAQSGQAPSGT